MDYEQKYKEILAWARKNKARLNGVPIEDVLPELAGSEDERIRMWLVDYFSSIKEAVWIHRDIACEQILAWLEKQKEPVVNSEGLYYYDGKKFIDCGYPATEENPYDFAMSQQEKQKKQKPNFDTHWENGSMVCEQKEPHYTKRNALFDKCVENCDPKTVEEVNKRVDDIMNMPELSAFEQALTNFIGYWEDDEEHWPSQFVKKHGKHILDIAREELEKEQEHICDSTQFEEGFKTGYELGLRKQKENPEEPKIAFGDWGDKEKQESIFNCLKYMRFIKKITNQEYDDLAKWLDSNLVCNLEIPAGDVTPEEDGSFNEDKFLERELSAFLQNYDKEYDDDAAVSDVARHFYEIGKKQKEQKPVDDKAFEEWIDDWYQGSKEAGGNIVMSEAEFKNWSRGIRNMYQQKPAEKHDLVAQLKEHLANTPKEQLEAEWKELEPWGNIGPTVEEYLYGKPAEWSEEDEKRVKQLIYDTEAIRAGYEKRKESLGDDFNDELIKDCDEQINWLKSLRPSWKPSEDDIKMLEHIIGQYEIGNKNSKVMGYLPRVEELNFLKKVLAKWKNLL